MRLSPPGPFAFLPRSHACQHLTGAPSRGSAAVTNTTQNLSGSQVLPLTLSPCQLQLVVVLFWVSPSFWDLEKQLPPRMDYSRGRGGRDRKNGRTTKCLFKPSLGRGQRPLLLRGHLVKHVTCLACVRGLGKYNPFTGSFSD